MQRAGARSSQRKGSDEAMGLENEGATICLARARAARGRPPKTNAQCFEIPQEMHSAARLSQAIAAINSGKEIGLVFGTSVAPFWSRGTLFVSIGTTFGIPSDPFDSNGLCRWKAVSGGVRAKIGRPRKRSAKYISFTTRDF